MNSIFLASGVISIVFTNSEYFSFLGIFYLFIFLCYWLLKYGHVLSWVSPKLHYNIFNYKQKYSLTCDHESATARDPMCALQEDLMVYIWSTSKSRLRIITETRPPPHYITSHGFASLEYMHKKNYIYGIVPGWLVQYVYLWPAHFPNSFIHSLQGIK